MRVLCAVALLLATGMAAVPNPPPPAIAVLAVDTQASAPDLLARQAGLVHLLQSDLQARSAARVLSRGQTSLFLDELNLAAAGLTEPRTAQRYGRAASADYLVLVKLAGEDRTPSATVSVQRVADGAEIRESTFSGSGGRPAALAGTIAAAVAQALDLPPAPPEASGTCTAPTVAVLDFHSEGEAGELDTHLAGLADLLSANLTALGMPLVERSRLEAILQELGVSASGLVRPANLSRMGTLLGAQRVLQTSLIRTDGEVLLDSQLIEPETGLVRGSCRVAGPARDLPVLLQQLAVQMVGVAHATVSASARQGLARQETGSLEAALHAAAGWRLSCEDRPEEAVRELQQAVYLDPHLASAWEELAQQYETLRDYQNWAECARRFFAAAEGRADRRLLAAMAKHLADAEMWQGRFAEEEAAARLAISYDPENRELYQDLIISLAKQGKAKDVREFCEGVYRRYGPNSRQTFAAFVFALQWLGFQEVPSNATDEVIEAELGIISRALDAFDGGVPGPDFYLARPMADALLLACGATPRAGAHADLQAPLRHVEACAGLAKRMTTYVDRPWTSGRGWFVLGLIEYKLGHGAEAEEALIRCLASREVSFDLDADGSEYPTYGLVYYLLGHTYQDLLRNPARAIECYRRAGFWLIPVWTEAEDARTQLRALGASPGPRTEWLHTLGTAGPDLARTGRGQLLAWMGAHGYDMRFAFSPREVQRREAGVQLLVWEGRLSDTATADDLRAYVGGGGNLLILLADQFSHHATGPFLSGSTESLDVTLDWLLPAFGMRMSNHVAETKGSAPLLPGRAWPASAFPEASYRGAYFPLDVPDDSVLLCLPRPGATKPDTVAAVSRLGLGKVAVVALRRWFPSADSDELPPPAWQSEVLQRIMDSLSTPSEPDGSEAARTWAAARAARAARDFPGAVEALTRISTSDPDAAYWAGRLLDDKLGDGIGATQQYRRVLAAPRADAWLLRKANLALGVLAVRRGDEATAMEHLSVAAGPEPDVIWGEARVAAGDLMLIQGDPVGAAQVFREVADELRHSEPRFRALCGLAYSLEKQGKEDAARRVYQAILAEFGKALLPADFAARWPDPWWKRRPVGQAERPRTVADVIAAR